MKDSRGFFIKTGMNVNVPEPNDSDIHNHSFVGFIVAVLEDRGTAIVEDQCGDVFEIETNRLTIEESE